MSTDKLNVDAVREIAKQWLSEHRLDNAVTMGLPEYHFQFTAWRVALVANNRTVGQILVDPDGNVVESETTDEFMIIDRILGRSRLKVKAEEPTLKPKRKKMPAPKLSELSSQVILGDNKEELAKLPDESINLVVTSPPYYNARMDYADYVDYDDYLHDIRMTIRACHRVLSEGRFFAINVSPVLLRRTGRNTQSKRINIPFDLHPIFLNEGFDFIEDIIWMKSSGAGWSSMRGGGFARTRIPLRYKTNPITEYILIYRKHTDKLLDWNIRKHPVPEDVEASKVADGYETTNVWKIAPASDKRHSAVFPIELPRRLIRFYSFRNDVVLDPYAGVGTTAKACVELDRRYVMIERSPDYVDAMRLDLTTPIS